MYTRAPFLTRRRRCLSKRYFYVGKLIPESVVKIKIFSVLF
jgi:hypothetical protein